MNKSKTYGTLVDSKLSRNNNGIINFLRNIFNQFTLKKKNVENPTLLESFKNNDDSCKSKSERVNIIEKMESLPGLYHNKTEEYDKLKALELSLLISRINKYLGKERFSEFVKFCEKEDSNGFNTPSSKHYDDKENFANTPKIFSSTINENAFFCDTINEKKIHISHIKGCGPQSLSPDYCLSSVSRIDVTALVNTPYTFDNLASNCGGLNFDSTLDNDFVPVQIDGWCVP